MANFAPSDPLERISSHLKGVSDYLDTPKGQKTFHILAQGYYQILAEYMFVLLPLLVVLYVLLCTGRTLREVFISPEWSFGSTVLSGQLIIKYVSGALRLQKSSWRHIISIIAGLIVFCLIPSVLTLSLILISPSPPVYMMVMQSLLFVLTSILFIQSGENIEKEIALLEREHLKTEVASLKRRTLVSPDLQGRGARPKPRRATREKPNPT